MRIAVDGSAATFRDGGVGAYVVNLVRELAGLGSDELAVFVPSWVAAHLALDPSQSHLAVHVVEADAGAGAYYDRMLRWHEGPFLRELERHDVDVLFAPVFTFPSSWRGPTVVTVFDLAFEREGHNTPGSAAFYRRWARPCAERATAIVTPSDFTRRDVAEIWGICDKPVQVAHLAPSLRFWAGDKDASRAVARRELGLAAPYLLLIGDGSPRKNLARAIRAFAMLADDVAPSWRLVLLGKRSNELVPLVERLALTARTDVIEYCPPEHMPHLYGAAELFAYPSLLEGFGLPPLEAMACGTAVMASNATAVPEVLGDSALLFDPLDVDAIAGAMRRLILDDDLRHELVRRGRAHAACFDWRSTAQATRAVLAWVGAA